MNEITDVSLRSNVPPDGVVFFKTDENPASQVSHDLCRLASYLQELQPYAVLTRFADWWQHDGLFFKEGTLNLHELFAIVGTPRSLLESMPGDDFVFVGIAISDQSWYLRFIVDWDESGEILVGEYSITIERGSVDRFESIVAPNLKCCVSREMATEYFDRISAA